MSEYDFNSQPNMEDGPLDHEHADLLLKERLPRPSETFAANMIDAISGDDPEAAHAAADLILLALSHKEVQDAYGRLQERSRWWATV